jgi:membrane protein implicated in regulation of membrane protease activity
VLQAVLDWWDGVALWIAQLAFPFQFALVMVVLLPLCLGGAWLVDRAVDGALSLAERLRTRSAEREDAS